MKKYLSLFIILILLLSLSVPAFSESGTGTTYYVDAENGSDENSGTDVNNALRTLAAASEITYSAGDRLLLKAGGIFTGGFTAKGGGTAEAPVVIGAYGDTDTFGRPIVRSDEEEAVLLTFHNVAGFVVEGLEFTAPNGSGIFITSDFHGTASDITVRDCVFHDIWNKPCPNHNGAHCPILIKSTGQYARIRSVTLSDCEIYDCAFGIKTRGLNREMNPDHFVSPEESYNSGFLFERISLHEILHDAVIICGVNGMTVRDCSLINTSIRDDFYCAPMWSQHACNYVIENCEIAGATNEKDGMAIDFDGWTTDAVCQYIYSHDNVRFINSCCCDNYTKNANCTVRYCLSVNDNKANNSMANLIDVAAVDYAEDETPVCMENFRFYNNTLINCSSISCSGLSKSLIANNIFVGKDLMSSIQYMKKNVGRNGNFVTVFDGVFTNNCFNNMGSASVSKNELNFDPGFAGTDLTDKDSFKLSVNSGLLGKGIQTEEDMGEHDFYGNALSDTHNIGCYEGSGEEAASARLPLMRCVSLMRQLLGIRIATLIGFIKNLSNTCWLF